MSAFVRRVFVPLFCVLCFLAQPVMSHARSDRSISPLQWQKLTDGKAFSYKNEKEKENKPPEYKDNIFTQILRLFFLFLTSGAGMGLAWIFVIGIVAYIVYRLFAGNSSVLFGKGKRSMSETGAQQEEKDLATTDWDALMQVAMNNNDFRLAVRYSYMRLLQLLQRRELILYRNDKTNYEYYAELADTSYKQPFRQLSRQYEYAWYGHYDLATETFNEYMAVFNNLKNQLGA